LALVAMLFLSGCVGSLTGTQRAGNDRAPAHNTTNDSTALPAPSPTTHIDHPFETTDATVGPSNCTKADAKAFEAATPTVAVSKWPGMYQHYALFRVSTGSDPNQPSWLDHCVGWRFRMHLHMADGNLTPVSYLQTNGTALGMGLIIPIMEGAILHWDFDITDGKNVAGQSGEYPNASDRDVFGLCAPHDISCNIPVAQMPVYVSGNVSTACTAYGQQSLGPHRSLLEACGNQHTIELSHAHHTKMTVHVDYVYNGDIDFELRTPSGEVAGRRDTPNDPTGLVASRTEPDIVVTDAAMLSQTGHWSLTVWSPAGVQAEYRFLITFEV
jgi:hypothetical protein